MRGGWDAGVGRAESVRGDWYQIGSHSRRLCGLRVGYGFLPVLSTWRYVSVGAEMEGDTSVVYQNIEFVALL
jgi:hypothetical protein